MMDFFVLDDVLDKMVRKLFWIRQGQQNFADSQIISAECLRLKSEKNAVAACGVKKCIHDDTPRNLCT